MAYHFFIDYLELPCAPSELTVTIGSNNKTVSLIDGNEINVLKNPKLTEIKFDVELPRGRQYPFAIPTVSTKVYTDYFEKLMLNKTPTKLVITRQNPSRPFNPRVSDFESTVLTVSLEGYDLKESAENAYDIKVSLKFKECPSYGTVKKIVNKPVEPEKKTFYKNKVYVVKKGDCLWKISRQYYGAGSNWKTIYNTNKKTIEETAKKYGKKSSSNGWWIYPGCKLIIPVSNAD